MKKLNIEYKKKLLETVAFSYGQISLYELVQKEHRHFHPSANLEPSKADVRLTDRMIKVGDLMGIPLIDHVIVGGDNRQYFSLRAREMIKNPAIPLQSNYRQLDFESQLVAEKGKSR